MRWSRKAQLCCSPFQVRPRSCPPSLGSNKLLANLIAAPQPGRSCFTRLLNHQNRAGKRLKLLDTRQVSEVTNAIKIATSNENSLIGAEQKLAHIWKLETSSKSKPTQIRLYPLYTLFNKHTMKRLFRISPNNHFNFQLEPSLSWVGLIIIWARGFLTEERARDSLLSCFGGPSRLTVGNEAYQFASDLL